MALLTTMKPTFRTEWRALPPKEAHQILDKIDMLAEDPRPDAKVKKQLKYMGGKLHRLRSGNFRIIYTFDEKFVSLLALRRRDDETYDEDFDPEFLGGLDLDLAEAKKQAPAWEKAAGAAAGPKPLPRPITEELLKGLKVPGNHFKKLLAVTNEDGLYECPDVPDEVKLELHAIFFETPIERVLDQPDLLVPDVSDLLKYKEGSLLGFLLKLDAEQESFVDLNLSGTGPTLLKGGPGTGKSTVAIYRVKRMLEKLPKEPRPRILFTTYTNALVSFTKQLFEQLLGPDAGLVEVRTADSLVRQIVGGECGDNDVLNGNEATETIKAVTATATFAGNSLQQRAQRETVTRMKPDYLRQEICGVIQARAIGSVEEYLEAARPGRIVGLNATQRRAVWAVYERFETVLKQRGRWTWEGLRRRALAKVEAGEWNQPPYDAVVVDEAQDLDPCALRLLATLCADPSKLFITADANQSIYGGSFRWTDVHDSLKFRGRRTGVIRTNHRSTREIGEAGASYLAEGEIDPPEANALYGHNGVLPVVRTVASRNDEVELLARFLPGAARELRLSTSCGAVLVPSKETGRPLAAALNQKGIPTEFMPGNELDLRKPCVKVITLKSAKGLEFPVVAVAGFVDGKGESKSGKGTSEEEEESLRRERRSMFVGMTRAMRALLVVAPAGTANPLLKGFSRDYWNVG